MGHYESANLLFVSFCARLLTQDLVRIDESDAVSGLQSRNRLRDT